MVWNVRDQHAERVPLHHVVDAELQTPGRHTDECAPVRTFHSSTARRGRRRGSGPHDDEHVGAADVAVGDRYGPEVG